MESTGCFVSLLLALESCRNLGTRIMHARSARNTTHMLPAPSRQLRPLSSAEVVHDLLRGPVSPMTIARLFIFDLATMMQRKLQCTQAGRGPLACYRSLMCTVPSTIIRALYHVINSA